MLLLFLSDIVNILVAFVIKPTRKSFIKSLSTYLILFCVQAYVISKHSYFEEIGVNKSVLIMSCAFPLMAFTDRIFGMLATTTLVKELIRKYSSNWLYLFGVLIMTSLLFHGYLVLSMNNLVEPSELINSIIYFGKK